MYKLAEKKNKLISFIDETMKNERVELTARGKKLAEVKLQIGIFLGEALSPLLFVIAVMLLFLIYQPLRSGRIWHKVNF